MLVLFFFNLYDNRLKKIDGPRGYAPGIISHCKVEQCNITMCNLDHNLSEIFSSNLNCFHQMYIYIYLQLVFCSGNCEGQADGYQESKLFCLVSARC